MRIARLIIPTVLLSTMAWLAQAAEPTGSWRVEDGSAIIRLDNCRGALWGVVAWEKTPARDDKNPNPSLRGRPTLGSTVVINMRTKTPGRWEGQVYNARNGQTYNANLKLVSDNTLEVQGCVLGGIICGGQQWTRVSNAPRSDVCSRVSDSSRPN